MGDLRIDVPNGSLSTHITLKDALYAPDMTSTVISVSKIARACYSVSFAGEECKIKNKDGKTIGKIPANANGPYRVVRPITAAAAHEKVDFLTVHRRLGHISAQPTQFAPSFGHWAAVNRSSFIIHLRLVRIC